MHCFTLPVTPTHHTSHHHTYTRLQSHHISYPPHSHITHTHDYNHTITYTYHTITHTTQIIFTLYTHLHIGEAWHMEEEEDGSRGARYGSTTGHMDQAIFTHRLNRHYFHPTPHPSAHPPSTVPLAPQTLRHPGLQE